MRAASTDRSMGTGTQARNHRLAPAFRMSPAAVAGIDVQVAAAAPFAVTTSGAPLALQLLRPAATRIAVVACPHLASALALRAAAFGADVAVVTERPAPWQVLSAGVGDATLLRTMPADAPPVMTGLDGPLLTVFDHVRGGGEGHVSRSPWHTSLHVVAHGEPSLMSLFDAVDVVCIGRPAEPELLRTLAALRLPEAMATVLQGLRPDEVVIATRSAARLGRLLLTTVERELLGL